MRVAFVLRSVEVQPLFRDLCRRQLMQSKGSNLLCCFAISLPSPTTTCHFRWHVLTLCHCKKAAGRNINIYQYANIYPQQTATTAYSQTQHPPKGLCRHAHLFACRNNNNNNNTTQFLETYCLGKAQHNTLYFAARLASAVAYSLPRGTAAPWFNSKARFYIYSCYLLTLWVSIVKVTVLMICY